MTPAEIRARLDALADAYGAKGIIAPRAEACFGSHAHILLWLKGASTEYIGFNHSGCLSLSEAFAEVEAYIAAMPSPEETHRREFMALGARLVDYGREHGIPAEYVDPAAASIKALSENALTDQREAQ